jgi:hypothetical protein
MRRWGGLGLNWLLSAARRRRIRGGRKPNGPERAQKRRREDISNFCFLVLNTFALL